MSIIYYPEGKAREYAALACNLYTGCNHGCLYCYAPNIRRMPREQYLQVVPRRNMLRDFENDCRKFCNSEKAVLFCFMTDPYNALEKELRLTREALKIALKYKIPVKILTKSASVLDDIDIIQRFENHITVGMTLTCDNNIDSYEWEPYAAQPQARLDALEQLHLKGVHTWASFEPVIFPNQSLHMMELSIKFVDHFKIGKLNNYQGKDKAIDWHSFLAQTVFRLRGIKPFYIKKDLQQTAPKVMLYGNETQADLFEPEAFDL